MPDAGLQETNSVSRCVKRFVRVDTGLIAAGIAVLGIGFALNLTGTHAIWPASTEPQTKPTGIEPIHRRSFNLIGSAVRTESASESFAASAPCAACDQGFHFDGQLASFDERFASAFGSPGNVRGEAAEAGEHAKDTLLQQLPFGEHAKRNPLLTRSAPELYPMTTSKLAGVGETRLNPAEASRGLSLPLDTDSHTAIYDIAAGRVYLPNGRRLEAHSGLGHHLDDPRYVSTKGRGPTPPNVYNLALRERLFHGVRAIRLIPVGDGKMFGRDGILAHSYMLGRSGQSNGCVSFHNYAAFLNAFLRGEVDRLVVVEHLATTAGAKTSAASGG